MLLSPTTSKKKLFFTRGDLNILNAMLDMTTYSWVLLFGTIENYFRLRNYYILSATLNYSSHSFILCIIVHYNQYRSLSAQICNFIVISSAINCVETFINSLVFVDIILPRCSRPTLIGAVHERADNIVALALFTL